jgi:hypothetical protein
MIMVEETVSNDQEYRLMDDPADELERAVSDYLHTSINTILVLLHIWMQKKKHGID